jgi:hypothetical protein
LLSEGELSYLSELRHTTVTAGRMKNFNCYLTQKWFGLLASLCWGGGVLTTGACVREEIMLLSSVRGPEV